MVGKENEVPGYVTEAQAITRQYGQQPLFTLNLKQVETVWRALLWQSQQAASSVMPEPVKYLTRKQTAAKLNISLVTLDKRCEDGKLIRHKIGARYLFDEAQVDASVTDEITVMRTLPQTFRKNGLDYQLVMRNDKVVMYELKFDGDCVGWEVARIYHQKGHLYEGRNYAEGEVLPGNEKFGTDGSKAFHMDSRKRAEAYFHELTERLKMPNSPIRIGNKTLSHNS